MKNSYFSLKMALNNDQITKRPKGGYGKKCQTFLCKCQMAPENTQCCQGSKYK